MVLDLTPNYRGTTGPWFANVSVTTIAERLKVGGCDARLTDSQTEAAGKVKGMKLA